MSLRYPYGTIARIVAAVVLTPALVIGLTWFVAARMTALPEGVAFRVYDTAVTERELDDRLELLNALYGIRAPADPAGADAFRRQSAQAVMLSMVLDRAAVDEGIRIGDPEARTALDEFIAARFPDGRAGFVKLLGEVGASEPDVLGELARRRATAQLKNKIVLARLPEIDATVEQTRQYYDGNLPRYFQPEGRQLRNIALATEGEAARVAEQARAGADFATLARQASRDESTKDVGGDLGVATRASLEPAYGDAAFTAPPGAVFGPVRGDKGWNVGQVVDVKPGRQLAFEEIAGRVRSDLKARTTLRVWRGWLSERIRQADVEYADAYRPLDVDEPLGPEEPSGESAGSGAPR